MIDIILIALNDEVNIENMLRSLKGDSSYNKLIVVDGGSTDNTVKIAKKHTNSVYVSDKGMAKQTSFGLRYVDSEYIFLAECDHIYPKNFLRNLLEELKSTNWDAIQGTLDVRSPKTIWEWGHKQFYKVHQYKKGVRSIIACPQLWKKDSFLALMKKLSGGETYCFDTQRAEVAKNLGLVVGIGKTKAFEDQEIKFKKFLRRHINYGNGDYNFYSQNSPNWSLKRKLVSITHPAKRYLLEYPSKVLAYRLNPLSIPYLWLIALVRYSGWIKSLLKI